MSENLEALRQALQQHQLEIPEAALPSICRYAEMVWQWNEKLNLTRHTTWDLFVGRDLIDSVQLAQLLQPEEEVLDLGSGGGVPGIPLAILRPDLQISLAESVGKRAKVLNDMISELDLPVAVYAARGEDLLEDLRFDTITIRAVGSLLKLCTWLKPHLHSVGRLLVIKGPKWVEERGEARHHGIMKGLDLRKKAGYILPGHDGESVILEISRSGTRPD